MQAAAVAVDMFRLTVYLEELVEMGVQEQLVKVPMELVVGAVEARIILVILLPLEHLIMAGMADIREKLGIMEALALVSSSSPGNGGIQL